MPFACRRCEWLLEVAFSTSVQSVLYSRCVARWRVNCMWWKQGYGCLLGCQFCTIGIVLTSNYTGSYQTTARLLMLVILKKVPFSPFSFKDSMVGTTEHLLAQCRKDVTTASACWSGNGLAKYVFDCPKPAICNEISTMIGYLVHGLLTGVALWESLGIPDRLWTECTHST